MTGNDGRSGAKEGSTPHTRTGEWPARPSGEPPRESLVSLVALYNGGRHEELETAALELAAQFPRSAKVMQLLGASRLTRGRVEAAVDALRASLQRAPNDPDVGNLLGLALSRCGR